MCETNVGTGNLWLSFLWNLENISFVMINFMEDCSESLKCGKEYFFNEKSMYNSSMNDLLVIVIAATILFPYCSILLLFSTLNSFMWKISLIVFPPFILVCIWITSEFLFPWKIHLKSNCHNGFLTLVPRTPSQRVIRVILSKRFVLGCSNRLALKQANKQAQLNKKQLWSSRKIFCNS